MIWSFDIPGYETHIYSSIKERATLMLCPRVDNSTYLCPDSSLIRDLESLLYDGSRSLVYFVRPVDKAFVSRALRSVVSEAMGLVLRYVDNLSRSRGLATHRLIERLELSSDYLTRSAGYWSAKGFEEKVSGIQSLRDFVNHSVDLKRNR